MNTLWAILYEVGEKITVSTKYVCNRAEIFLLIWGMFTLLYMLYLLKSDKKRKCYLCSKYVSEKKMYWQRFADSPKDFEGGGYKALICEPCAEECEQWTRA